jgi:hypothetical protein
MKPLSESLDEMEQQAESYPRNYKFPIYVRLADENLRLIRALKRVLDECDAFVEPGAIIELSAKQLHQSTARVLSDKIRAAIDAEDQP